MVLFLSFIFLLSFNDFFYININIISLIYVSYMIIYTYFGYSVVFIFSSKIVNYKLLVYRFTNTFYRFTNTFYRFTNTFYRFNLTWKPLFKKSSYFGLYRSNKNQWLNK